MTPKSGSILPSITRRSLMYVAEHYLGLEAEEREVSFAEVKDFAECGLCGTAAVISPVGKIVDHGKEICFPSGMEKMGPVIQKLYDTLTEFRWDGWKLRKAGFGRSSGLKSPYAVTEDIKRRHSPGKTGLCRLFRQVESRDGTEQDASPGGSKDI